jgi:hypothetical protein
MRSSSNRCDRCTLQRPTSRCQTRRHHRQAEEGGGWGGYVDVPNVNSKKGRKCHQPGVRSRRRRCSCYHLLGTRHLEDTAPSTRVSPRSGRCFRSILRRQRQPPCLQLVPLCAAASRGLQMRMSCWRVQATPKSKIGPKPTKCERKTATEQCVRA